MALRRSMGPSSQNVSLCLVPVVRVFTMLIILLAILQGPLKNALAILSSQSFELRSKLAGPECEACAPVILHENYRFPAYIRKPGFLTPAECEWFIAHVNQRYVGSDGQVGGMGANGTVKTERRKAIGTSVSKTDASFAWVLQRTLDFVRKKNAQYWQYNLAEYDSDLIEDMHFVMYNGSLGGFYDWHSDTAVAGARSLRKVSAVLILSDPSNYTGGAFLIKPEQNEIALPRDQGSLILFPSFVLHKVDPVTSGYRHSIVMQIGGYN